MQGFSTLTKQNLAEFSGLSRIQQNLVDIANIIDIADIVDITDIADIVDIVDIINITDIADIIDITVGIGPYISFPLII